MNRNDYHHGDHRRVPLLARKVSSSSSCEESPSSSAQHAAPSQDRDQQDRLSPLRTSPSSPVGSPRMGRRSLPRMAPFNPKVLIRRTSSGLRDELGDLIGELSLSSQPQRPQRSADVAGKTADKSVVTPETSMDADPPPRTAARAPADAAAAAAKREKFLLFVRILFKCLDTHPSVPPALRVEAKRVIRECTAKNRAGVPGYTPLVDALESRLREVDGMGGHWERAEGYLRHYLVMRGRKLLAMKKAKGAAPPPATPAQLSPMRAVSSDVAKGGGEGRSLTHHSCQQLCT